MGPAQIGYAKKISQEAETVRSAGPQASRTRRRTRSGPLKDLNDASTTLADVVSLRLRFGFAVIQMPMLPVEPGMAQFMSQNVPPSRQG
jgi:hypothetical protein